MAWHSTSPDGTVSVRSNLTVIGDNTTYIETTMGNSLNPDADHYWNIGADEDGRHRKVCMRNQGTPLPVTLLPGTFDGAFYVNDTPNAGVPTARFATQTLDYQLSDWENITYGTFTSAAAFDTTFTICPVIGGQYGKIQIFFKQGGTGLLAMEGHWISRGASAKCWAWSGFNQAGKIKTNTSFAMPIELDHTGGVGLFIKAIVPNGFGFSGSYLNGLYDFYLYTRTTV